MAGLLFALGEVTMYSGVLYLGVLLVKKAIGGRLSPGVEYLLWFLVIARLLMPLTFHSGFHFWYLPTVGSEAAAVEGGPAWSPAPPAQRAIGGVPEAGGGTPGPARRFSWEAALIGLWAAGVLVMLGRMLRSAGRLRRQIRVRGRPPQGPAFEAALERVCAAKGLQKLPLPVRVLPGLPSPALTAEFFPCLLLPAYLELGADHEALYFSITHEMTHYRRGDHLVCLLLALLRAVYWFNPVVWLLARGIRRDMEAACDAAVSRHMDKETRLRYAKTLLSMCGGEESHTEI